MAIFESTSYLIKADSDFDWDLSSFESDALYQSLVVKKQAIPLTGKAPAQPKASMGFGLKKKPVETESDTATNQHLVFDLDSNALSTELLNQFKRAHRDRLNKQAFCFIIGLGSLKKAGKSRPVLCIPVHLVNDPALEIPFCFAWSDQLPFLHHEVIDWLAEADSPIPQLPDVLSDISVKNFFHDLTYKLNAESGLTFTEAVKTQRIHFEYKHAEFEDLAEIPLLNNYDDSFTHTRITGSDALAKSYAVKDINRKISTSISAKDIQSFVHNLAVHKSLEKPVIITSAQAGQLRSIRKELHDVAPVLSLFDHLEPENLIDELITLFENTPEVEAIKAPQLHVTEIVERLHEYDDALNGAHEDEFGSPAEIMAFLLKTKVTSTYKPHLHEYHGLTASILNQRKLLIKQLLKLQGSMTPHPVWDKAEPTLNHAEMVEELEKASLKLSNVHRHIKELTQKSKDMLGVSFPDNPEELEKFIKKLHILEDIPQFERHQLDQNWYPIPDVIPPAFDQIHKVKQELEKLKPYFHLEIVNEPLENLIPELEALSHSPKRYVDWNYRQHAKRLLGYARANTQKFDHAYIAHLRDVVKVQKEMAKLSEHGKLVARYFGSYWNGLETDEPFLKKQMVWMEGFSKLKLEYIEENIDQLKRLILRKDTQRAVSTIKDLRNYLIEKHETENHICEIMGIKHFLLVKLLEESEFDIKTFFDDLIENSESLKQRAMLHRLKESENAKRLERFIEHIIEHAIPFNDAADRYEHAMLVASLKKMEDERDILSHLEISDIKQMLDLLKEQYHSLCEYGVFKKMEHYVSIRKQPSIKKRFKEQIAQLKQLRDSDRMPHTQVILQLVKDILQQLQTIVLCTPDQLAQTLQLIDAHVITTTKLEAPNPFSNLWLYIKEVPETAKNYPIAFEIQETPKAAQIKGEVATDFIIKQFEIAGKTNLMWVFESDKAENAFWHKVTHSAIDFKTWTKALNDGMIQCTTFVESDLEDVTFPFFDVTVVDFSFVDPKANPFALKKSSPKILTDSAKRLSKLGFEILLVKNEGDKSDDVKKKTEVLQDELSWKLKDETLFASQLKKATFLEENPVKSLGELSGFVATLDGRVASVWSDYALSEGEHIFTSFHDSLIWDASIYNPIRKLYKKADSLILDSMNFIKNEPEEKSKPKKKKQQSTKADESVTVTSAKTETEKPKPATVSISDPFSFPDVPMEFTFTQINNPSKAVKPKLNKLPRIKSFAPFDVQPMGEADEFFTVTARSLKKGILEIVKAESPINWHRLTRLLISGWKMERLNENALTITKKLLAELAEKGEVGVKEGVIYETTDFKFTIRSRADLQDFNAEEIPMVELEMALFLVLDQYHPLKMEDLLKAASFLLGFDELTQPMETVLKRALIKMGMEDVVCVSEAGFQLTRPILL
ncbi:hypothetical protein EP331_10820 [bacterium]|nr:MAG: hypothetical protein EP331_10820 [bacterium]